MSKNMGQRPKETKKKYTLHWFKKTQELRTKIPGEGTPMYTRHIYKNHGLRTKLKRYRVEPSFFSCLNAVLGSANKRGRGLYGNGVSQKKKKKLQHTSRAQMNLSFEGPKKKKIQNMQKYSTGKNNTSYVGALPSTWGGIVIENRHSWIRAFSIHEKN